MVHSINYIKIKRQEKESQCNICGNTAKLSWDHIPPKNSIFFENVEVSSIFTKGLDGNYPKVMFQNGTKFRTICEKCNNMLGYSYDLAFRDFIHDAAGKIYSEIGKSEYVMVDIQPVKILKSLFGHLLAAKGDYEETLFDVEMRNFVFDENLFDTNINVFYWFHPYINIEIIRDIARCEIGNMSDPDIFSMLKMYPISFYISKRKEFEGLHNLTNYLCNDREKTIQIPLDISVKNARHHNWPVLVDDNTLLLGGPSIKSAVFSKPKDLEKYINKDMK